MVFQIEAVDTPIRFNSEGVALVGSTRVLLSSIIWAFQQGETPEQIIDSFDALSLADVYSVIAYYLHHRDQIDTYIVEEEADSEALRHDLERRQPKMFTAQSRLIELKRAQQQD